MSNSRITPSGPVLILPIGDPEFILLCLESFRSVYKREDSPKIDKANQEPIHKLEQAFKLLEGEGPPQSPAPCPQSTLPASNLEAKVDPHFGEQLCRMVAQEKNENPQDAFTKQRNRLSKTDSQTISSTALPR